MSLGKHEKQVDDIDVERNFCTENVRKMSSISTLLFKSIELIYNNDLTLFCMYFYYLVGL
jgi:hypothetical protein